MEWASECPIFTDRRVVARTYEEDVADISQY